jgi:hypothetical protein
VFDSHFIKSSDRDYSLFAELVKGEMRERKSSIDGLVHYWRNSGNEKKIALQTDYMKHKPLPDPR